MQSAAETSPVRRTRLNEALECLVSESTRNHELGRTSGIGEEMMVHDFLFHGLVGSIDLALSRGAALPLPPYAALAHLFFDGLSAALAHFFFDGFSGATKLFGHR